MNANKKASLSCYLILATSYLTKNLQVPISAGVYLFPFRTEKSSPPEPMVLR
jgi:hypothetical protein